MKEQTQFTYTDGHNKDVTRTINHTLNIDNYLGTPGYPLLFMAANTHLSLWELGLFLYWQAERTPGVERTRSWLQRRRWLFLRPETRFTWGNRDGRDEQARALIGEHPQVSLRTLVRLLGEHGISRSKEWVRQNRVAVATTVP